MMGDLHKEKSSEIGISVFRSILFCNCNAMLIKILHHKLQKTC